MKAILKGEAVENYIDLHKKLKIPYKIILSNYTTRIMSNAYDLHFMKTEQSNQTFAAFAKIKKECLLKPLPIIQKDKLKYFTHKFKSGDFYADTIYNFDLKSAYANILLNDGYISKETFLYINKLPKLKRLAAVGMLAGKKNIYEISADGKVLSEEKIISETSNYFFYCVQKMAEIIKGAADILGNGFLFSWVDGIYFIQNPDKVEESSQIIIEEYFNKINTPVTFEVLTEFQITEKKNHFKTTYLKEGKIKIINIAKEDSILINKITSYLLHN